MSFAPNERYRYAFKEGMTGWDVVTIQVALNAAYISANLVEDGSFGPLTKAAVEKLQRNLSIVSDGICGVETQKALCLREVAKAEVHLTPKGLLKGIVEGESGYVIPTTSAQYPNHTRDYGPYQDNKLVTSDEVTLKHAFQVGQQGHRTAEQLAIAFRQYSNRPGTQTAERGWHCAILSYNWPAAAEQIANGTAETWTYTEEASGKQYKLNDPAPWIEQYGVPGVTTGWDWIKFYISSKDLYVTSWVVV
jgi:peptidoglycan hydrolase-like protein with peptidoglycan-binding domain